MQTETSPRLSRGKSESPQRTSEDDPARHMEVELEDLHDGDHIRRLVRAPLRPRSQKVLHGQRSSFQSDADHGQRPRPRRHPPASSPQHQNHIFAAEIRALPPTDVPRDRHRVQSVIPSKDFRKVVGSHRQGRRTSHRRRLEAFRRFVRG